MSTYTFLTTVGGGLTNMQQSTYAHGLGKIPDFCYVDFYATQSTATAWYNINILRDATNITVQNAGGLAATPSFKVLAMVLHSIII